jgi:hypothetical protein
LKTGAWSAGHIDDKQPKNVVFDCLGQTREHYSLFLVDLGSDFFRAMNFVSSLTGAWGAGFFYAVIGKSEPQ